MLDLSKSSHKINFIGIPVIREGCNGLGRDRVTTTTIHHIRDRAHICRRRRGRPGIQTHSRGEVGIHQTQVLVVLRLCQSRLLFLFLTLLALLLIINFISSIIRPSITLD